MTGRIQQQFFGFPLRKKVTAPKQIDRSNTFPPTLFCLCRDAPDYIHTRKDDILLGVSLLTNQILSFQVCFRVRLRQSTVLN